jgi:nucleoid-associated protein YgaU
MGSPAAETEMAAAPQPEPMTEMSSSAGEEIAAAPPAMAPATETAPGTANAPAESSAIAETEGAAAPEPAPSDGTEVAEPPAASPAEAGTGTMAAPAPDRAAAETMAADAPAGSTEPPTAMGETSDEAPLSSEPSTEMAAMPPASDETPAAAETATAESAEPPAPAEPEAESPAVVEAPPPVTPAVGVAAVEAETNGALYIAGTATTPEPVRVYVDEEFVGEATPTESGTWLVETTREMAPDEYTIRADQIEAGSGTVVARAEVPFQREIDVATLRPIGESVSAGTAEVSGSVAGPMQVIIKRGDNLWRISREMYGHGIRYSTIYQANRDQIRNPNLIYPGQVFVMPAGDTAWESQ